MPKASRSNVFRHRKTKKSKNPMPMSVITACLGIGKEENKEIDNFRFVEWVLKETIFNSGGEKNHDQ